MWIYSDRAPLQGYMELCTGTVYMLLSNWRWAT